MTPSSPPRRRKKAAAPPADPPVPPRPLVTHHLVPPHELLSAEETATVVQSLGVAVERLPRILLADPGLKTDPKFREAREAREPLGGRLVRIRRPSPTAGESIAYRMIVASPLGD